MENLWNYQSVFIFEYVFIKCSSKTNQTVKPKQCNVIVWNFNIYIRNAVGKPSPIVFICLNFIHSCFVTLISREFSWGFVLFFYSLCSKETSFFSCFLYLSSLIWFSHSCIPLVSFISAIPLVSNTFYYLVMHTQIPTDISGLLSKVVKLSFTISTVQALMVSNFKWNFFLKEHNPNMLRL